MSLAPRCAGVIVAGAELSWLLTTVLSFYLGREVRDAGAAGVDASGRRWGCGTLISSPTAARFVFVPRPDNANGARAKTLESHKRDGALELGRSGEAHRVTGCSVSGGTTDRS